MENFTNIQFEKQLISRDFLSDLEISKFEPSTRLKSDQVRWLWIIIEESSPPESLEKYFEIEVVQSDV